MRFYIFLINFKECTTAKHHLAVDTFLVPKAIGLYIKPCQLVQRSQPPYHTPPWLMPDTHAMMRGISTVATKRWRIEIISWIDETTRSELPIHSVKSKIRVIIHQCLGKQTVTNNPLSQWKPLVHVKKMFDERMVRPSHYERRADNVIVCVAEDEFCVEKLFGQWLFHFNICVKVNSALCVQGIQPYGIGDKAPVLSRHKRADILIVDFRQTAFIPTDDFTPPINL